jgi:cyclic pyranopterin phosphate synthase
MDKADKLTHLNESGRPQMVDVGDKKKTNRLAIARGVIAISGDTYELIMDDEIPKGDVLYAAQLAGIMAAKNTSNIIPMCHPLPIDAINIEFTWDRVENGSPEMPYGMCLNVYTSVASEGKTGVEMEALVCSEVALLTVYDMCKAVDKNMMILGSQLLYKRGGKSGEYAIDESEHIGEPSEDILEFYMDKYSPDYSDIEDYLDEDWDEDE